MKGRIETIPYSPMSTAVSLVGNQRLRAIFECRDCVWDHSPPLVVVVSTPTCGQGPAESFLSFRSPTVSDSREGANRADYFAIHYFWGSSGTAIPGQGRTGCTMRPAESY